MSLYVPNVDELIAVLAEKGVQLWADGNQLRDLTMRVTRAVVDGVVGKVKTEYSEDDLPLDPDLPTVLLNWKLQCPESEVN